MDKDAKRRPLILAKILFERTDEEHYLTTAQLMEILEKEHGIKTHRQTIPGDIEILRSFGMDIQDVMSAQKRYNLVSREFDLAELKMLIDAVESAKFISRNKSEQLVKKLSELASQYQAKSLKRNISDTIGCKSSISERTSALVLFFLPAGSFRSSNKISDSCLGELILNSLPAKAYILSRTTSSSPE